MMLYEANEVRHKQWELCIVTVGRDSYRSSDVVTPKKLSVFFEIEVSTLCSTLLNL